MAKILWDAQAAKQIETQELDAHFNANSKHYKGLAKTAWNGLEGINDNPTLLKHDDLFDVLLPVIERDARTLAAFKDRKLPGPSERNWTKWHEWFTHYIVERFQESTQ